MLYNALLLQNKKSPPAVVASELDLFLLLCSLEITMIVNANL